MILTEEQIHAMLSKPPTEMTDEEKDKLIELNTLFRVMSGKDLLNVAQLKGVDEFGYKKVYFQPKEIEPNQEMRK